MEAFSEAAGSEYTRGHVAGAAFGDGSFNVWANLWALPTHPNLKFYWSAAALLCALQVRRPAAGGRGGGRGWMGALHIRHVV